MEERYKKEILRRAKWVVEKLENNIMDMSWKEIDDTVMYITKEARDFK